MNQLLKPRRHYPTEPIEVGDPHALRKAFASFATGIVIVSTRHGGEPVGATVSSFNSVSLDPPLVLFSIARSSKAFAIWNQTGHFAVSILSTSQHDLSTKFAKSLGDKWSEVQLREAAHVDAPLIDNALMWFECETFARYGGGDHVIILGKVISATRNPLAPAEPLIFFGGAYRNLTSPNEAEPVPEEALWLHGW